MPLLVEDVATARKIIEDAAGNAGLVLVPIEPPDGIPEMMLEINSIDAFVTLAKSIGAPVVYVAQAALEKPDSESALLQVLEAEEARAPDIRAMGLLAGIRRLVQLSTEGGVAECRAMFASQGVLHTLRVVDRVVHPVLPLFEEDDDAIDEDEELDHAFDDLDPDEGADALLAAVKARRLPTPRVRKDAERLVEEAATAIYPSPHELSASGAARISQAMEIAADRLRRGRR